MEPIEWILLAAVGIGGLYAYSKSKASTSAATGTTQSGGIFGALEGALGGITGYTLPNGQTIGTTLNNLSNIGASPSSSGDDGYTAPSGGTLDDPDIGDNSDDGDGFSDDGDD